MTIPSLTSTALSLPPSAVAFCPSHTAYYVVGTYFLHPNAEQPSKAPQKRTGTLELYCLEGTTFSHVQTLRLDSAVLDLEWTPLSHVERLGCMLCVATSTGSLEFFSFDSVQGKLEKSSSHQISSPDTLVLDLIWHPKKADVIAVTLSDGGVMLFHSQREDGGKAWSPESEISTTELATHSLEPWTLAFSHDCKKLFSGGDDAVLQAIRLDGEESTTTALWTDRRTHNAGVTAILPLPLIGEAELLITGSYDDSIRLLAAPDVGRRQILAELDLGGGVWRLKMLGGSKEEKSYTLLASCMHAGARVVRLKYGEGEWAFSVLAEFTEHQSMNYGSDVQPLEGEGGKRRTVVSTSFYDKLMCVWEFGEGE